MVIFCGVSHDCLTRKLDGHSDHDMGMLSGSRDERAVESPACDADIVLASRIKFESERVDC